ncbi:MAG: polysaccharide biosynthesis/export family protein [Candidatus Eremiobacteraeota bacterium]|nr:polysaccharide biosynthesis/export family protein [Candidatus Eremiobacteraeota bacterium]
MARRASLVGAAAVALGAFCGGIAGAATLHPGDKVSISVYNHPELAVTSATVDSTGRISVPLAGLVQAENLSPRQLSRNIEVKLAPYVRRVAVDVQLLSQGQNIFVTGGPGGVLTYAPGETITGALAQIQNGTATQGTPSTAADPTLSAAHNLQNGSYGSVDLHHVVIKRDGRTLPPIDAEQLIAKGNPGPALQPDDTIVLVDKPIAVVVKGEVRDPGTAHLDADEPLANALLQVGGADAVTARTGFLLTRNGTEQVVTASSPQYRQPAQPGDSIYVAHTATIGVVGQVYKPGDVVLKGDNSLLSALYFAGGPTTYGDIRHVAVLHQGVQTQYDVTKLTHGAPSQNPQLADGDTVFVPEGHKIDFQSIFRGIVSLTFLRYL